MNRHTFLTACSGLTALGAAAWAKEPTQAEIQRLIERLGNRKFAEREQASLIKVAGWFHKVRDGLKMAGIEGVPPRTVRNLHVIVEEGAISDGLRGNLYSQESRLAYDRGPFHEVGQTGERAKS